MAAAARLAIGGIALLVLAALARHHWRAPCAAHEQSVAIIVVAKNEHDVLSEWVEHHLAEGVAHIYLADDNSDLPLEAPESANGRVTILRSDGRLRQVALLEQLAATAKQNGHAWALSIDVDEYAWPSQGGIGIDTVLSAQPCGCTAVMIDELLFGDRGLQTMPETVRGGFTRRASVADGHRVLGAHTKWAVRLDRAFGVDIHKPQLWPWQSLCHTELVINHYKTMTHKRYMRVKATRGHVYNTGVKERTSAVFRAENVNSVSDLRLQARVAARSSGGAPTIHMVWLDARWPKSQDPAPPRVRRCVEQWAQLNPAPVRVRLWQNADVERAFPGLFKTLQKLRVAAWAADLTRYHIVAQYGGVYVDTDFEPFRPLPYWMFGAPFAVMQSPHETCNCVFGAPANNKVMRQVASSALRQTTDALNAWNGPQGFDLRITGPPMFSALVMHTFTLVDVKWFFPCTFVLRHTCGEYTRNNTRAYAKHLWTVSWHKTLSRTKLNSVDATRESR